MPDRQSRGRNSYYRGQRAELWAGLWLILHGYWPLAWRYKTPVGEIDLIMRKGRMLVFVEVKTRQTPIDGLYAITPHAQLRIGRAASLFMASRPQIKAQNTRFDALLLVPGRLPYHIKNAWMSGE